MLLGGGKEKKVLSGDNMKCPKCAGEFEKYEALFFDDHYKCPLCGNYFKPEEE